MDTVSAPRARQHVYAQLVGSNNDRELDLLQAFSLGLGLPDAHSSTWWPNANISP